MDIKHFYDVIRIDTLHLPEGEISGEPFQNLESPRVFLGTFDDPETSSSFQTCKNGRDKLGFLRHAVENEHEY